MQARSAGATSAATAGGWYRSAARSCRPIAAPPTRIRVAASSPNPIPTTKSRKPQRNSTRSCRPWGYNHERPKTTASEDRSEERSRTGASGSRGMSEVIRPAKPGDEAELTAMIHELAEFERASADCIVTETHLREALFGKHPTVFGHIAEVDGEAAAGALWFRNFSTWDGVAGIYLEDLFVRPQFRRRGL